MAALLAKALAIAVFVAGPCPDAGTPACAVPPNVVYLNTADWPVGPRVWTLHHELGHIVDYNLLTDQDRGMFSAIMHIRRPWVAPPNSPHEQFAEAVAMCAHSTRWPRSAGGAYDYRPTVAQHRKVCRWLASVGVRPTSDS